jgi:simple sugar transport system substrate-binding protein
MRKMRVTHAVPRGIRLRLGAVTCCAAAALALAGCGSSSNATSGTTGSSGGSSNGKELHFVYVWHSPTSDPFAEVLQKGMEQAAQNLGVSVKFLAVTSSTFEASDQNRLLADALASHPDGIITSDPAPSGMNSMIKKITGQGIPVILVNQGVSSTKAVGALTYVGDDETGAGEQAAQKLYGMGVKHLLFVTIPPGNPVADLRNKGVEEGYKGDLDVLKIPLTDYTNSEAVEQAVLAQLTKNPQIDGVMSVTQSFDDPLVSAQGQLGSRAKSITWAGYDFTENTLNASKQGQWDFSIDQQPFLEGYLPVQILAMYDRYDLTPLPFTFTGPNFVTSTQAAKVLPLATEHLR